MTHYTNGSIIEGMSFAEYRRLPGEHATLLKRMLVSPLHYFHARKNERPDTDDFRIGRATHTAILEPDRFALDCTVYTASKSRGDGARKAWEEFQRVNAGRTILDTSEYKQALAMRDAVHGNPLAHEILTGGAAEVSATWRHFSTEMPCKARFDYLSPRGIVDVKTTSRIDPNAFSRDAAVFAYHVQFAFYAYGHEMITGDRLPFWAVVVEKSPPHDVVVYRVPESVLEAAANQVTGLLERVKECERKGEWPGVAGFSPLELTLPEWVNGSTKTDLTLDFGDGDLVAM